LINDYPEARRFYMERAWQRRIEFRRRQKKFISEIAGKLCKYFDEKNSRLSDESKSADDKSDQESDNEDSVEENGNLDSD
jgi:hypothetical protein